MNAHPIFHLSGVTFSYQSGNALTSIDLAVKRGEQLALVGANGSGKSTLLRLLAGLSFPSSGSVHFDGRSLTPEALEEENFFFAFRRRVGIVFQNPDVQLFNSSVFDEIAFAPLQLRLPGSEVRTRVETVMESLGISELRDRAPHRLSGGEKKRVALASVLVSDPEVLLLDEPVAALDPPSQAQILELLSSWRGGDKTVILATHDLDSLEDIADCCCVLNAGQIAAFDAPLALLHNLELLKDVGLIRPHHHTHAEVPSHAHGHFHTTDS